MIWRIVLTVTALLVLSFVIPLSCRAAGTVPKLVSPPTGTPFTFAVIGDYRGDSDGNVPPVLLDIFTELNRENPSFVLSSGDLINGYPEEDEAHIRKLWDGYRKALEQLKPPIFHVPGNHDIFNDLTRRLWSDYWGPTYYSFDYAGVRFIGLDTETDEHRIGGKQLEWLREELNAAGDRRIFLFLHEPLFPIDGRIGTSLDAFAGERDGLHSLFVEHRDRIEGIFLGHEHLFHFEERDGIRYYISAGSGAPLYVPEEIGGFYHYLVVRVEKEHCAVELRRMWDEPAESLAPRVIEPGELLETYEHSVLWSVWDQTVRATRVDSPERKGEHALQLRFDLTRYEWPSLATTFAEPRDLKNSQRLQVDVFVPAGAASKLAMKATFEGDGSSESPEFNLQEGWNTFDADLDGRWLAPAVRHGLRRLQLSFEGATKSARQSVVVGDVRFVRAEAKSETLENWASPLQWGVWDESVHAASERVDGPNGNSALRLSFDFAKYQRPRIFAKLRANWDLSGVERLSLDTAVSAEAPPLKLHLALTAGTRTVQLSPSSVRSEWSKAVFELGEMPRETRKRIHTIEWWLEPAGELGPGSIAVRDLRADTTSP